MTDKEKQVELEGEKYLNMFKNFYDDAGKKLIEEQKKLLYYRYFYFGWVNDGVLKSETDENVLLMFNKYKPEYISIQNKVDAMEIQNVRGKDSLNLYSSFLIANGVSSNSLSEFGNIVSIEAALSAINNFISKEQLIDDETINKLLGNVQFALMLAAFITSGKFLSVSDKYNFNISDATITIEESLKKSTVPASNINRDPKATKNEIFLLKLLYLIFKLKDNNENNITNIPFNEFGNLVNNLVKPNVQKFITYMRLYANMYVSQFKLIDQYYLKDIWEIPLYFVLSEKFLNSQLSAYIVTIQNNIEKYKKELDKQQQEIFNTIAKMGPITIGNLCTTEVNTGDILALNSANININASTSCNNSTNSNTNNSATVTDNTNIDNKTNVDTNVDIDTKTNIIDNNPDKNKDNKEANLTKKDKIAIICSVVIFVVVFIVVAIMIYKFKNKEKVISKSHSIPLEQIEEL